MIAAEGTLVLLYLPTTNILAPKQQSFACNCRLKNECPLNGECQTPSVIYRADVVNDSNDEEKN